MMTILFNLVALKDYIFPYRKYLNSTSTLKRAIFYSKICPQNFSLPNSIVFYMAKNPTLPKFYEKMIQSCKYFFFKNPILIIPDLRFRDEKWCINYVPVQIDKYECKFWVTKIFNIGYKSWQTNHPINQNLINFMIPKIYKLDVRDFLMTNQIIFFNDLPFLFSSAEVIYFDKIIVKNENGENVALEKVIEIATNVKNLFVHESGFKAKILNQFLNFPNKLEHIFLVLQDDFDLDEFYSFMKKNKNIKIFSRFDDTISDAYKTRLELIIDEILATTEFVYKPPMIEFNGLDREKYEKLREIHNCYKRLY